MLSLAIKDMQIKSKMSYHFTPTRMAIIKKDERLSADSSEYWRNWIYHTLWWE